jgi:hypothetical protein
MAEAFIAAVFRPIFLAFDRIEKSAGCVGPLTFFGREGYRVPLERV